MNNNNNNRNVSCTNDQPRVRDIATGLTVYVNVIRPIMFWHRPFDFENNDGLTYSSEKIFYRNISSFIIFYPTRPEFNNCSQLPG